MFVVTNRNIENEDGTDFGAVGDTCNTKGPAELRLLEVTRKNGAWHVQVLRDKATDTMLADLGVTKRSQPVYASQYAFKKIFNAAMANPAKPKHVVFFVHGFNNTVEDVVVRCDKIAKAFDVVVVAFSWPANGGGIKGVADYREDKRDAQASVMAFDRVLEKARVLLHDLRATAIEKIITEIEKTGKYSPKSERFRERLTAKAREHCPIQSTLMLHSMGNYLLERTLKSTALGGNLPLFDNIVMCSADVNNPEHAEWVDRLQVRNRLYVTINEDDSALKAARLKGGEEQLARLGHWTSNLTARDAVYLDFTNAKHVGSSHAYFEGKALKNAKVKNFFAAALQGRRAEQVVSIPYDSAKNLYRVS
jgi:esterase/lipase superfamily enzyme